MEKTLQQLRRAAEEKIRAAGSLEALRQVEIEYFGRGDGQLTAVLRGLPGLPLEQRKAAGQLGNEVKTALLRAIAERRVALQPASSAVDFTQPGRAPVVGHRHLVSQAIDEIAAIFERIGFQRSSFPEVEWEYYAFTALNMPPDHPARDEWETFFVDAQPQGKLGRRILTPHTSNGQVREMERHRPPIRTINIGTCYRRQSDVSHVPMFHQFEGLLVDAGVTMAHLIGTIDYFVRSFYGTARRMRIRPSHFCFTEPSIEVDIDCCLCRGSGCRLCKAGWLELCGAGMVHPNVLKAGRVDPKKYSGFAFAWGVERCFLMKSGLQIPDIRMLYSDDLRFLQQF